MSNTNNAVKSIESGSVAAKSIIKQGDLLLKINGHSIVDFLDYQYYSYDEVLHLELKGENGKIKLVTIYKDEGEDLGLEFDSYLIDDEKTCENNCIFCFMNQLPSGMRSTLYCKDDDVRLSFLHGNYITLTNLEKSDIERIIKYRISPINISIHTLNPELRVMMMGNKNAGDVLEYLAIFAKNDISFNCQIVCCPGVNDGKELEKTIIGLMSFGEALNSVSIVPVGLTKYRDNQYPLVPFSKKIARSTIMKVHHYARVYRNAVRKRTFYCADEIYMMAGMELPSDSFYEDYPQLENGVGMMRLFISEFDAAFYYSLNFEHGNVVHEHFHGDYDLDTDKLPDDNKPVSGHAVDNDIYSSHEIQNHFSVITGKLAYPYIKNLVDKLTKKYVTIRCDVYAIENNYFGHGITVSGLVTGKDIIEQLTGKELGTKVLIPENMLKHGEDILLDDVTISELSEKLGVSVVVVEQNGADFFDILTDGID